MHLPDYEYTGLMAQSWDVLRGDTSAWADRAFYLRLIERFGQPVLDVGCGTGRLLLDYLAEGVDIDGVDNSPEMLEICRAKAAAPGRAPALHQQYMETLSLPRRYRTILVPSSTLQLVTDPDMALQSLRRLLAHLLPGGIVAASFMTLWSDGDPLSQSWEQEAIRAEDGATVKRLGSYWYDPASECSSTEDRYQILVDGQVVAEQAHRRSPAVRSYTQAQAAALFAQAGFESATRYSRFTLDPAVAEDKLFTVVGAAATV